MKTLADKLANMDNQLAAIRKMEQQLKETTAKAQEEKNKKEEESSKESK